MLGGSNRFNRRRRHETEIAWEGWWASTFAAWAAHQTIVFVKIHIWNRAIHNVNLRSKRMKGTSKREKRKGENVGPHLLWFHSLNHTSDGEGRRGPLNGHADIKWTWLRRCSSRVTVQLLILLDWSMYFFLWNKHISFLSWFMFP